MLAPIHTIKHYVHIPAAGVASGASLNTTLVSAIAKGATRNNPFEIEEGAIVKAIYIEWWVKADNPNFTVNACIVKLPADADAPTFSEMANLGSYTNKKNILEFHQGLAPSGDQTLALFRAWYKIPKGKQRFGLGDKFKITTSFTGSAGDVCGMATFKEYE